MKIAYLMNAPIPSKRANSVHVMKMCQAFKKNNIDIELFCEGNKNEDEDEINKIYGINNKFKINKIYVNKKIVKIIPYFLCSAYKMYKELKKRKDIKYIYGRALISIFLLRNKYEFIYESHISPINSVFEYLEKNLLESKNCIKFVVISEALKNEYLRIFPNISPEKIEVLHDCADSVTSLEIDNIKLENNIPNSNSIKIGYLGHLYPGKCMEILTELALKRSQYHFHIVGGTNDWVDYWRSKTDKLGIYNITYYGYVDNSDIAKYYNSFDICILPFSRNVYFDKKKKRNIGAWISPLKLFEAMSFEKPILVSKLPTIEEVLIDNHDCLMVEPEDIESWGNKLDLLVNDEELRKKISKNALKVFEDNYTWEKRTQKIINFYSHKSEEDICYEVI